MNILLKIYDVTGALLGTGGTDVLVEKNHCPGGTYILVRKTHNKQVSQSNM